MQDSPSDTALTPVLVETLYAEAMTLADDARTYFSSVGQEERKVLPPMDRVLFSCESLKVTTRVMHALSWLMVCKAVAAGEMTAEEAALPERRLGFASSSDEAEEPRLLDLPPVALSLIRRSQDLYTRVKRIEEKLFAPRADGASPVQALQARLEKSF